MAGLYGLPGAPVPRLVTLDRNIGTERVLILPALEWEELASGILTNCPTVTKVLVKVCLCIVKVKSMERSGSEAIRPQIQPSKPKREITDITKKSKYKKEQMVNQVSSYFLKGGHSATETELKII